jgi:sulfur-carrier protein
MADDMITIDVRLFASLAVHAPADAARYAVRRGATVARLLEQLGLPAASAKLIFINGVKGQLDSKLSGGERVGIFPPVGGG